MDSIPLDDAKTFELFSRGETTAIFQFESPGMKKYMRALQPNRFEDLIAMNALYRPGPMDYIPSFVNRKHHREPIVYDIPEMEEVLKDTYGITVYQEQVMLLSQKLAGFTKGQADALRKAMGKKLKKVMDELKEKFVEGCLQKGYDKKVVEKIWSDWESFAEYAFNKSHSTCYAYVAYQTAYLKAHYPSQFMAAVLSRNLSDIKKITTFMDECRRMGIQVLGPDVNESQIKFAVMPNGDIRFGLGAIKGMGENAAQNIIDVRGKGGRFKSIFDFFERVNLQTVNKKNLEVLAVAGAFDNLIDFDRSVLLAVDAKGVSYLEQLMRYGIKVQSEKNTTQQSLFGTVPGFEVPKPAPPKVDPWPTIEKLNKEKEVIGIYLSAHPLDEFRFEIESLCNVSIADLKANMEQYRDRDVTIAGMTIASRIDTAKNGKQYGRITLEDYTDSMDIMLFGKDFESYRNFCFNGYYIMVRGKVQPKTYKPEELELHIKSINMLYDVREKMIKSITLNIPLDEINDIFIDDIMKYVQRDKAKIALKFKVYDPEYQVAVDMFSRAYRVNITPEFINYLHDSEINYKVAME
jgi:DNA polymerase-3 subunit alpha